MEASPDVVGRVTALVRAVAAAEPHGAGTTALARVTGLARPTAHRLLASLQAQGYVDRGPDDGLWVLGPELFLLGVAAAPRYDVTALAQPFVRRLALATEESAFYSTRRGDETVCLMREDGSYPVRSHVLSEGVRFPLGVASAGLAILAFLPEEEARSYVEHTDLVARFGEAHAPRPLRARLAAARRVGWALNPGLIVRGSFGMAAAVFDAAERPIGALSLTGVEHRFSAERRPELGALLLRAAHELSTRLRTGPRPG